MSSSETSVPRISLLDLSQITYKGQIEATNDLFVIRTSQLNTITGVKYEGTHALLHKKEGHSHLALYLEHPADMLTYYRKGRLDLSLQYLTTALDSAYYKHHRNLIYLNGTVQLTILPDDTGNLQQTEMCPPDHDVDDEEEPAAVFSTRRGRSVKVAARFRN